MIEEHPDKNTDVPTNIIIFFTVLYIILPY